LLWFRAQPLRLVGKVLRHGGVLRNAEGKKGEKRKIIKAIWKGTRDGIKEKF
jgi:hypothetical protein